jgi:DNA (cytosine-5)-methyltransferase 1
MVMKKRTMFGAKVIDLFCGIGGMTHGFKNEGFDVVAGIDVDPTCRYAFESNNKAKFIEKDLGQISSNELNSLYRGSSKKILIGCAPCQPFSNYSNPRYSEDKKWMLVRVFANLIKEVAPDIVSMENVPALRSHYVFKEFLETLEEEGFYYWYDILNFADYGVPQNRIRLVLLASKFGEISLIPKTHLQKHVTVGDSIKTLEHLCAGQASTIDPLHQSSKLSRVNLERVKNTPEGGGWKDWPEDLLLNCHKKVTGRTFVSVYGRMTWDKPSPTITTQFHGLGNGRFGHPNQDRAISLREAAIIQTFPKDYKFTDFGDKIVISNIARHIGNAVPPRIGQIIARSIRLHLEGINA